MKAVAYRGGQRERLAPGGTLRGAVKEDKKKKEKKGKRDKSEKKKKRETENIWEKHVITVKLKWNILASAPLCSYNLTFWRPIHFGADAWLHYTCFCIVRQNV